MAQETRIQQDLDDIHGTQAAMAQKLEQLEERIQDTVEGAKAAVRDIVDHVQTVAEHVIDRVEEFMADTTRSFDPRSQMSRHPWLMLGGAVLAGYILGSLEAKRAQGRPREIQVAPSPEEDAPSQPSRVIRMERNVWDILAERVQDELNLLKGALLVTGESFVHDFFTQVLPALGEPLDPSRRRQRPREHGEHTGEGQG